MIDFKKQLKSKRERQMNFKERMDKAKENANKETNFGIIDSFSKLTATVKEIKIAEAKSGKGKYISIKLERGKTKIGLWMPLWSEIYINGIWTKKFENLMMFFHHMGESIEKGSGGVYAEAFETKVLKYKSDGTFVFKTQSFIGKKIGVLAGHGVIFDQASKTFKTKLRPFKGKLYVEYVARGFHSGDEEEDIKYTTLATIMAGAHVVEEEYVKPEAVAEQLNKEEDDDDLPF